LLALAMLHAGKAEWSARRSVRAQVRHERVLFRIVQPNPVGYSGIEINDHNVPPIRRGTIAAWTIDPECRP
jgi:hypothetical protein